MLCDDTLQCVFATLPPHVLQYVKRVSRQFRRCARNTIHGDWLENIDGEIDFRHKVSVNTFALEIPGVGMFSSVEEVVHVIGMDAHWKTHYDFLNATTPYLKVGRCRFPFAPKPEIEESFLRFVHRSRAHEPRSPSYVRAAARCATHASIQ